MSAAAAATAGARAVEDQPPAGLHALGIARHFGGVRALDGVDLHLQPLAVTGLIGPNGAGKTTLLDVLSGVTAPTVGTVVIDGTDVTGLPAHARVDHGLVRSFQGVRLFPQLSTRENVHLGALRTTASIKDACLLIQELLERLDLMDWVDRSAQELPYGIGRRVGLARCLAARPKYLLLDEPAAGLDEDESLELAAVVADLPATAGCAVLVIEHSMPFVAACCAEVQVLAEGRTLANGTVADVFADPSVIDAYLGSEAALPDAAAPC